MAEMLNLVPTVIDVILAGHLVAGFGIEIGDRIA
jgi:hypothetical protein